MEEQQGLLPQLRLQLQLQPQHLQPQPQIQPQPFPQASMQSLPMAGMLKTKMREEKNMKETFPIKKNTKEKKRMKETFPMAGKKSLPLEKIINILNTSSPKKLQPQPLHRTDGIH